MKACAGWNVFVHIYGFVQKSEFVVFIRGNSLSRHQLPFLNEWELHYIIIYVYIFIYIARNNARLLGVQQAPNGNWTLTNIY